MTEVLKEALKQTPSLAVLVVVVWMFLRFMKEIADGFSASMASLHKDHLDARLQSRTAITDNTEALRELTAVVSVVKENGRK